jgi:glutamate/tyrosine decarboxylase-like PLP-dependent enzyme
MTRRIINFEMLQGICTEKGMKAFSRWWNSNLSDGRDKQCQELAKYFIDYHARLIEKPWLTGIIEYSASAANQRALKLMRNNRSRRKVLVSNLAHHPSLVEGAENLGLEIIPVFALPELGYQVPEEAIRRAVEEHGAGNIAGIVSTHGTTQLGSIEEIASYKTVQKLREQGVWLHVDAAFGGVFNYYSTLIKGEIPDADSITLDPYKLIGVQGAALLLGRDEKLGNANVTYYNHSQFTRVTTLSAGPVALWAWTIEDLGEGGPTRVADGCVENARRAGQSLSAKGVPLITRVKMNIVLVKLEDEEQREELRDWLYEQRYVVGRIDIKGQNYRTHGIRIVCSPREHPFYWAGLAELENKIVSHLNGGN